MNLTLNTQAAKSADSIVSSIRDTGKYVGTITRAEAIKSTKGSTGLGLSFKSDQGATADYLDLWTHNADGEELSSFKTVNALLACLGLRGAEQGPVKFTAWDAATSSRVEVTKPGYPAIQGKKVGLLLRKTIDTNIKTGKDRESVEIFGIFQAGTELVASEILDRKTTPERLGSMLDALLARPVNDKRKGNAAARPATGRADDMGHAGQDIPADDDIPF